MFLKKIVQHKEKIVAIRKEKRPLRLLEKLIDKAPRVRPFLEALRRSRTFPIIAEIKKASPSKGVLRSGLKPVETALIYQREGAAAISVLTEEKYFLGSLQDLKKVREAVEIPVLCKDFILDPYQLFEARLAGADAVLLIAALYTPLVLRQLMDITQELRMDALVEVHDRNEFKHAIFLNPEMMGVNNRNLKSFKTTLATSRALLPESPSGIFMVSESGIRTYLDILALRDKGCGAVLVGETLIMASDPAMKLKVLLGKVPAPLGDAFQIKVCGVTRLLDALLAVKHGANIIGFNFYKKSPRFITPRKALAIAQALPPHVKRAGVFVDEPAPSVRRIAETCGLDVLQFHGQESPSYCASFDQEVIRTVRVGSVGDVERSAHYRPSMFLFDSLVEGTYGGTGKLFAWNILKQAGTPRPFILAGGLTPENVREAIRTVRPDGVDVCSGVESEPGKKDSEKLKKFMDEVKSVLYD